MSGPNVRVSMNMLTRGVKSLIDEKGTIAPADLVNDFGVTEAAARKVLSYMVDSGDIDRQGSRRSGYTYVKMSPEREAELAPIVACREEVLAHLTRAGVNSATGTLSRVSLSLADMATILGIEVPEALRTVEAPDSDEDE